jgi:hypothetical protein
MTKWEYRSIRVHATYDWHDNVTTKVAFEIETADEEISLPPQQAKVMLVLNRLGGEGWEVIAVNYDRLPDGVIMEYFLKRPLAELSSAEREGSTNNTEYASHHGAL